MALFGSKKNTKKASPETTPAVLGPKVASVQNLSGIILRPRITEKASTKSEGGVYVFDVSTRSTKASIKAAVRELYNVLPVRVSVASIPDKKVFARGGWGTKRGGKKAYVYLKKGETIEFV